MKATINITTKAGKSFKYYPFTQILDKKQKTIAQILNAVTYDVDASLAMMHPGDKITIEITD